MMCAACTVKVPQARVELGYRVCVGCSTVEAYGCVDIVYHKTGNTVQPMERATADLINKAARRSGFGVMRGMLSGSSPKQKLPAVGHCRVAPMVAPQESAFQRVGELAMNALELEGREEAERLVRLHIVNGTISIAQAHRLHAIIALLPGPIVEPEPVRNPYLKHEPVAQQPTVPADIAWAFSNWKR